MNKIKKYKFSELYEMSSGISSKPEQAGHGAPFVSFKTVFNNYFLPESLQDLMDTSEEEQKAYSIKEGDIFLTRTSESLDELGMSCVACKNYPKATYSGFLKRLRPIKPDLVYPKYMAFYLRSQLFRKTMNNNSIMTLRASFNEQIFSYLDLMLPEYKDQKAVGDLLFLIHQKIELNNKINAELEGMAKLMYDYWFVQFDFPYDFRQGKPADETSNPKDVRPYKSSGGKMVWNKELKREVPEGWISGYLSDLGKIIGGSTPSKDNPEYFTENGIPWITPKDLSNNVGNKFIFKGELDVSEKGKDSASLNVMPRGTILMSSRAPIGYLAISVSDVTTNQGFKSFVPDKPFTTEFVYYKINEMMPVIENNASGSTFKEVSGSTLKGIKIVIPSNNLIEAFTQKVAPIFEKQENLQKQNQQLSALRDWLLPMLMNGQVRVD